MSRYLGVPLTDRVWAKIDFPDDSGCWNWLAGKDSNGYGRVTVHGVKALLAHRLVYFNLFGPTELGLDHLCRNTSCVNPAHLEPVPQAENVRRGEAGRNMRQKTRCPQGHPYAGANLILRRKASTGTLRRDCRICQNEANRAYRRRKAMAA